MTFDEVVNFYRNGYQFTKKTKISATSFYKWRKRGFIPIESQMKIESVSGGLLKARFEDARYPYDR